MEKEFLENLQVGEEHLPQELVDVIWDAHTKKLQQVAFSGILESAIARHGGKNQKAIAALLDVQTLQESDDMATATEQALLEVKNQCGYLFETAPHFARGTGTAPHAPAAPTTLAGALRERFRK